MALVLYDRVQETGTANTTVSFTLSGAVSGYQSFSVVGNGNTTYYAATDSSGNWEVGIGTYATGGTLTRTTILSSSNAGAAETFTGSVNVFVTYPASQSVNGDGTTIEAPSGALLPLANGGTGASSAPYAMANLMGFTSTATAAGTTTLTNTSSYYQIFTGATTQTVVLPVTSTLQTGWTFHICNNSTGALTVNSSGGNLVISVIAGTTVMVTCIGTTLTTAADWEAGYTDFSTATGTGSVALSTAPSFVGITATGALSLNGSTTSAANFATSVTTGTVSIASAATTSILNLGGTAGTGTLTFGRSTGSQTTNIQAGATASGSTKTINIGTAGLSGSFTNIAIGSNASGASSTTTLNGFVDVANLTLTSASPIFYMTDGSIQFQVGIFGTYGYVGTQTTNPLYFRTDNLTRMAIDTSGNVGIGTSSPPVASGYTSLAINNATNGGFLDLQKAGTAYVRLEIDGSNNATIGTGSGTTTSIRLQTNNTERMRIDSSGRVLIGSTSARANLFNSTSTSSLQIEGTTADNSTVLAVRNTDTAAAGPFYILARARGTAVGSTTVVQSGDVAGTLSFQASDGTEFVETARIQSIVDGTPGANDMPGALIFNTTADGAASSTERMRIDSAGNVGIGTSAPTAVLQLKAGTATANTAPLKLTAGTNLTTAEAGAVEYDGTVFYGDFAASARGVFPAESIVVLNTAYTLTSQTAAQQLFNNTASGALTLPAGTYQFECGFALSSMSATSGSFGFALGGGATFTQQWRAIATKTAAQATVANGLTSYNTAASVTLVTASTSTFGQALIRGIINITVGGTIIPQVSLGVAAAAVVGVGSYFRISPISGTSGATNITVGNWS